MALNTPSTELLHTNRRIVLLTMMVHPIKDCKRKGFVRSCGTKPVASAKPDAAIVDAAAFNVRGCYQTTKQTAGKGRTNDLTECPAGEGEQGQAGKTGFLWSEQGSSRAS
jgi:hypothetical protein